MQPPEELRDVLDVIPSAILDVRYASADNFTGRQLYNHQLAWLRAEPLEKLVLAAEELAADGFKIVIFDAYRPPSVQKKLRDVCSDEHYVAEVSNHCRGITIDLTLADEYGVYLDMGTDYDNFSEKAHSGTKLISKEQELNRRLLKTVSFHGVFQQPAV